jgi:hypothetical protein
MKIKNILLKSLAIIALAFTSCQDFEELAVNPNQPTTVPASLVFNRLAFDLNENPWGAASQYAQYWCINYEYYGNQNYNWTTTGLNFGQLNDVLKMEEEAAKTSKALNPYSAIGKFFRAYFFVNMAQRVGDVPLSEALKAGEGVFKPKYNTQKEVYVQALQWLEQANNDLTTLAGESSAVLGGDIYFGGDLRKWRKMVNSYRLRVLVSLSKRASETDLNVQKQFSDIISNPTKYPIFESTSDNLQLVYNATTNKYPTNPDNFGFNATRYNMSETYIKTLTSLKDPRVFAVAEPAEAQLKKGLKVTDYEAYVGAGSGEGLDNMSTKALAGEYSFINRKRYYSGYLAEPNVMIGYVEMCFNIAEGINRGWATGNAEDWYKKGVSASMKFYGVADTNTEGYLGQADCKYKGNNADGLKQILTQKYLGFFQSSGWEAFYNQRRTGVPTFLVGGGNTNGGRVPKRWQYPASERNNNADNYKAALTRQFGAEKDDINTDTWLTK